MLKKKCSIQLSAARASEQVSASVTGSTSPMKPEADEVGLAEKGRADVLLALLDEAKENTAWPSHKGI